MAEINMVAPNRATTLPSDPLERKKYPIASGVLDYFPDAIVAVARVSWEGNNQHNPGEPLHWARGKSMDQDNTLQRHFLERGKFDTDGQRHTAKAAWRILALLQLEIEADAREMFEGVPGSVITTVPKVGDMLPPPLMPYCGSQQRPGGSCCTLPPGHVGVHVGQFVNGKVCGVWK